MRALHSQGEKPAEVTESTNFEPAISTVPSSGFIAAAPVSYRRRARLRQGT
jgi:hypothetical protein